MLAQSVQVLIHAWNNNINRIKLQWVINLKE